MKATQLLHNLGQSIWLDNITRDLLDSGNLKRCIDELSVTGLASNPTIFNHAIKNSAVYSSPIRRKLAEGKSAEALFFELALEDLTRAAGLLRPIFDRTNGVDGWVSLEVSPLLAYDTAETLVPTPTVRTLLVGAETRRDVSCFDMDDFAFPQVSKERRIGCEETKQELQARVRSLCLQLHAAKLKRKPKR